MSASEHISNTTDCSGQTKRPQAASAINPSPAHYWLPQRMTSRAHFRIVDRPEPLPERSIARDRAASWRAISCVPRFLGIM